MQRNALLIGNSDGIGLVTTRRLLAAGWTVSGISRSPSPISDASYHHAVADVASPEYTGVLSEFIGQRSLDLCIYLAGIGENLNLENMDGEARIFEVNLTAMVKTAAAVVPPMVKEGTGHFIGVSSLAGEMISAEAPSYSASKAGFSNYLDGLSLSVKSKGVCVTNVRFGFVDTKMAKGDTRPFMMSVDRAVDHLEKCIRKRPSRYTAPRIALPLIKLGNIFARFGG